jgi:hypothetical protein
MSHQRARPLLFRLLPFALLLIAAGMAEAQQTSKPCTTNKNAPPPSAWHWPAGTRVKVYFKRDMFTKDEQQVIRQVMDQWAGVAERIGVRIKYEYAGESDRLMNDHGSLLVMRGEVRKESRGKLNAHFSASRDKDGLVRSAWLTLDFKTRETGALKSYVAHELAHGMGLWDCKSCKAQSTIMKGFSDINKGNGLVAPSACDLEVVKALYEQKKATAHEAFHQ